MTIRRLALALIFVAMASVAGFAGIGNTIENVYDDAFSFMAFKPGEYPEGQKVVVTREGVGLVAIGRVKYSRYSYVFCELETTVENMRPERGDTVVASDLADKAIFDAKNADAQVMDILDGAAADSPAMQVKPASIPGTGKTVGKKTVKNVTYVHDPDKGYAVRYTDDTKPGERQLKRNYVPIRMYEGDYAYQADDEGSVNIEVSDDNRKLVTLEAKDVTLGHLLREIAERTDIDIYVNASAEDDVYSTIVDYSFSGQTIAAGLQDLLKHYGLAYYRNGGSFHVASEGTVEDEYKEYVEREKENGPIEIEKIQLYYADADTVRDMILSMNIQPAPEVVKTYVGPIHNQQADTLQVGGRSGSESERSLPNEQIVTAKKDFLLVKGTRESLKQVHKVVDLIDTKPTQLIFKALIMEIDRNNTHDYGADYTVLPTLGRYGVALFDGAFDTGQLWVGLASKEQFEKGSHNTLYTVLHTLLQEQKAKILNNPTITTLDGQPAVIRVGKEIPMASSNTTVNNGSVVSTSQVDYKHIGMTLYLVPRVDMKTREISLMIHPILSEIEQEFRENYKDSENHGIIQMFNSLLGTGGNSKKYGNPNYYPNIVVRETNSMVRLKDGEEVVIGGLIRRDNKTRVKRVPLLSEIPLVGELFRHTQDYVDEQELIIILVPYIVDELTDDKQIKTPEYDLLHKNYDDINEDRDHRSWWWNHRYDNERSGDEE